MQSKSVLPAFEEIKGEYKIESQTRGKTVWKSILHTMEILFVGLAIKNLYKIQVFSGYISIMAGIGADGNFHRLRNFGA